MTRERLEQYESLMQELTEEQERLAQETRHARWIEETYGVGCLLGVDYLEQSRARVRELSGRRTVEQHEVRGWIDGVRDSMTRRALRLRYLDGMSWADIARRMGYAEESGPRKLVAKVVQALQG